MKQSPTFMNHTELCAEWLHMSSRDLRLPRRASGSLMLICIQLFDCSNFFVFNSCVYSTTRYNKCDRIGTKWLFFFILIEECCVIIEKDIDKKLANRISYQIWYKRCLKGKFGTGSKSAKEVPHPQVDLKRGSISVSGFWPGVHIR